MTIYITRGNYSDHAFQGMLHHPEDRHDPVIKMVEAAGGKMLSMYVTMGEYDFMTIAEFDNELDGVSALMVAAGTGGVRNLNTTVAITTADAMKAEAKARNIAVGFKPDGRLSAHPARCTVCGGTKVQGIVTPAGGLTGLRKVNVSRRRIGYKSMIRCPRRLEGLRRWRPFP